VANIIDPFDPYLNNPPLTLPLDDSVGTGWTNYMLDVGRLQHALNHIDPSWGGPAKPLEVNGEWDKRMVKTMLNFKKHYYGNAGAEYLNDYVFPGDDTVKKIEQILGGAVDVVVMQKSGDEAMRNIRAYWAGEIEAVSISQMVAAIKDKLSKDMFGAKKIKYLFIIGHAAPGHQAVGSGKKQFGYNTLTLANLVSETYSEGNRLKLAGDGQTESDLAPLAKFFVPGAVVTLGGCRVSKLHDYTADELKKRGFTAPTARTIDGRDLLKAVSLALGNVWVQGGDATQEIIDTTGVDGQCWRCNSSSCVLCDASTGYLAPG